MEPDAPAGGSWHLRPDFWKRLAWTLGLLAIVPLLWRLPLLSLNTEMVRQLDSLERDPAHPVRSSLESLLTLRNLSMGAYGLTYLPAGIAIVLLACAAFIRIRMRLEAAGGWRAVEDWAGKLAVPLSLLMAPSLLHFLASAPKSRVPALVADPGFLTFYLPNLAAIAGATALCLIAARQISLRGLGNGALSILALLPAARFLLCALSVPDLLKTGSIGIEQVFLAALPLLLLVALCGVLVQAARRLGVTRASFASGPRAVPPSVDLALCPASIWPLLAGSALADLLAYVASLLGPGWMADLLGSGWLGPLCAVLVLTAGIAVMAHRTAFNPGQVAESLKEAGAFFPEIRPGRKTEEYLRGHASRVHLAGIGLLVAIGVVDTLVQYAWYRLTDGSRVPAMPSLAVVAVALWLLIRSARLQEGGEAPPPDDPVGVPARLTPPDRAFDEGASPDGQGP